jgi:hypothetical protein
VGRALRGPARITAILPQENRIAAPFGRLQVADDIFQRAAQVANGRIVNVGDIEGEQVT